MSMRHYIEAIEDNSRVMMGYDTKTDQVSVLSGKTIHWFIGGETALDALGTIESGSNISVRSDVTQAHIDVINKKKVT